MKIKNIGNSNFILKDKRGNVVLLEPSFTVDVDDSLGAKFIRIYPFIKEVKVEKPKKVEVKEVEVSRETPKKKSKRKKDGISNIG